MFYRFMNYYECCAIIGRDTMRKNAAMKNVILKRKSIDELLNEFAANVDFRRSF